MMGVSAASYLSTRDSSPSSGCFYDTGDNLLSTIRSAITRYSGKCHIGGKNELQGAPELLDKAEQLGELKGIFTRDPAYTVTEGDRSFFSSDIFSELSAKFKSRLTVGDVDTTFNSTLNQSWRNYAKSKGYDTSKTNNAWILARFGFAEGYLQTAFGSNLEMCLPVNEDIRIIFDLIVEYLNDEESPSFIKQEISNKVQLESDVGGYALAFWIKEDNSELIEPFKYVQGFLNNKEMFNFRLECCRVIHVFSIGNDEYNFYATPSCTEYAFVLLTFEKIAQDVDTYKFKGIIRLSHSNLRYEVSSTNPIPSEYIDNLQITFPNSRVKNPTFFSHFEYSSILQ